MLASFDFETQVRPEQESFKIDDEQYSVEKTGRQTCKIIVINTVLALALISFGRINFLVRIPWIIKMFSATTACFACAVSQQHDIIPLSTALQAYLL